MKIKHKLAQVGISKIFTVIGIMLMTCFILYAGVVMASQDDSIKKISEKELNKHKYQQIKTDYVTFELPKHATHYWINGADDKYEVILHNVSILNNNDYILKFIWEDEGYIDESFQIHYDFKNGKLKKGDISFNSLKKYDRECLMTLPEGTKIKSQCEKSQDKSKLKFKNVELELGTIIGQEYKLEYDKTCIDLTDCQQYNVSYPIYSWQPFSDIDINNLPSDFLAIDDVNVSACGVLSTAGETYTMNGSIIDSVVSTCMDITAENITLDCAGYTIDGTDDANSKGILTEDGSSIENITIKSCIITDWDEAITTLNAEGGLIRSYLIDTIISSNTKAFRQNNNFAGAEPWSIINTTIENNDYGIRFYGSYHDDHIIANSTIQNNINYGLYFDEGTYADSNNFYNNLFNNTINIKDVPRYTPYSTWNTTKQLGTNIYDTFNTYIGGNYWANPSGTGYSETCSDSNSDGFCDSSYTIGTNNIDYLPLTYDRNPSLILDTPKEQTYSYNESLPLNYTISDTNLDACWYKILNSTGYLIVDNLTIIDCLNTTFDVPRSDTYNLTLYTNDTAGNLNSSSVTFSISTDNPAVVLDYPTNNLWITELPSYFNFTASDSDGLSYCQLWGNWTGTWHNNYTWISPTSGNQNYTTVNMSEGIYKWNVWCNDTVGSEGWALNNFTVKVDTINPSVIINSITTTADSKVITFNHTTTDTNIDTCKYSIFDLTGGIDGANENISFPCGTNLNVIGIVTDYATYNLTIYATDKALNENSTTTSFTTSESTPATGGGGGATTATTEDLGFCGDGVCNESRGETFFNCPEDCSQDFKFPDLDAMIFNCFDEDVETECVWATNPGLFLVLALMLFMLFFTILFEFKPEAKGIKKWTFVPKKTFKKWRR